MARTRPSVKNSANVTISRPWQIAFLIIVGGAQLLFTLFMLWSQFRYHQRTDSAALSLMFSQTFYPLLFVLVGYAYALRKVQGTIPRLFWAVFLAMLGLSLYYSLQLPVTYLSNAFGLYSYGPNNNWWSSVGWVWVQMSVVFVLYCLTLWLITRRSKGR
jgi:hypothetical protein